MAHPLSSATSVHSVTPVPGLFTATPARLASMLGPRPQGPMHGRARSFTSKPCSSFRALKRRSVSRLPSSRQSRPVHTKITTGGGSFVVDGVVVAVAANRRRAMRVDACRWRAECWRAAIGAASHTSARICCVGLPSTSPVARMEIGLVPSKYTARLYQSKFLCQFER